MSGGTADDVLVIPCLGRPFRLGMLYDCRNDCLIPGVTLWGAEKLNKAVSRDSQESCDFEIIAEDSLKEKAFRLEVGASLKLSLLGGLVDVAGAAEFLYDHRSSTNYARVSLKYKSTSRFEQLTMDHLGEFEYPAVFDEDIATHVVTGVLHGADAFFVFDREVGKGEDSSKVHSSMEGMLSALPGIKNPQVGIQPGASLDLQYDGKGEEEKLKCKFHGDFILPKNPTTFHDAVKVYQELPNLFGKESTPKKVWLHPLGKLDSRAQKIVREISFRLIDEMQILMEKLHDLEMRCNDLIKSEVCSHFLEIKRKLQKARELISGYKASLVRRLATLLPQIRGGGAEEVKLSEILEENSLSPFGHQHLSSWLNGKKKEVSILTGYLQKLQQQHVQLAFAPGEMEPITQDLEVETVLCFDFNVTGRDDVFLQKVETYLRKKQVSQEDYTQKAWHSTPALMQELRLRLRLYLDFVEANHSRNDVKYVVTDGGSEAAAESSQVALITLYKDGCPTEFELPDHPGKPTTSDVTHNSLKLSWAKPKYGVQSVQSYTLFRRPLDGPTDNWVSQEISSTRDNIHVSGLAPETVYVFKLAAETAAGTSPESQLSDPITTKPSPDVSLALKMRQHCKPISKESTPPIFQLPTRDVMRKTNIAKVHIGHPARYSYHHWSPVAVPHKVLMVVGATGAGKSTLINGIANYIMGVRWEDEFRFKLISEEGNRSQAHSQTRCITAYTFHPMEGSPLPYTLTIIDTPGFGDTEGLERDKEITAQIKEFFSITGEEGIDQLNGIGFVTQASLARLTQTQRYIFDSILSIFGKDIGSNIFLMTTFADGQPPPVLDAVKEANVPIQNHFKFNNSALFPAKSAETDDDFNEMFWRMGVKSFNTFFKHFANAESRSLQLTKEVLKEREQLETTIQGLQPQIRAGLARIDELRQEEQMLKGHEAEILANEGFAYTVTLTKQKKVDLPTGVYTTNCLQCNYTCHEGCTIASDSLKLFCSAMEGSFNRTCAVCPGNCSWMQHKNNPYKFVLYEEEETRTLDDLKARYESAMTDKSQVEAVIDQITADLEELDKVVYALVQQANKSLQRLEEIALKPNPLTEVEYIDLLIESEKQQAKPGWMRRVKALQQVRGGAEIFSKLRNREEVWEYQPQSKQASGKNKSGRTFWETIKSLYTENKFWP